jgi:apolipoprotein N-acyltransferase
MLTVIQPPIDLSYLAWVSLVPFILICSTNTKPKYLALVAYIVSSLYWLANLYWIAPITIAGWLSFCLYTALLWPLVALSLRYCRAKKIPLFLAAGVLFVGAERLQGLFLGGFFWRFLAHSQYQNITLIQITDIFGTAGLSFLIAMVNGLLAELILDARCSILDARCSILDARCSMLDTRCWKGVFKISDLIKTAIVCAAVVAAVIYGRWRINQSEQFITQGPLVASLQSNVPQSVKREALRGKGEVAEQTSQQIFDELLEKSKAAVQTGAEIIVWPETMIQAVLSPRVLAIFDPCHPWVLFDQTLKEHAKDTAYILAGAYGGTPRLKEDSTIDLAQRYNSAFLYRPDGQQDVNRYDKIHLVLFGEVLPFRKSCPFLFNLVMKFNPYDYDHSLDAGSEYTIFEMTSPIKKLTAENAENAEAAERRRTNDEGRGKRDEHRESSIENRVYKFGVMICYEDTMPEIARRFVADSAEAATSPREGGLDQKGKKQADWLINISNDGWFVRFKGDKVIPDTELPQHAAICVFRAVENRVSVIRSVNTGISCLIDSLGRIHNGYVAASPNFPPKAMQRKGLAGWFADKMPIDKRVTFFSKYGQWLDFCCATGLVLLIIVQLLTKLLKGRKIYLSEKINEKPDKKR